jgi:hypothetical protein
MQGSTTPTQIISLSSLISSLIGFLLGLISGLLSELLKRRQEKQRLINLFRAELMRTHMEIGSKQQVPVGEVFSRGKYELFGIRDVAFSGAPEYELEVYTLDSLKLKVFGSPNNWGHALARVFGPHLGTYAMPRQFVLCSRLFRRMSTTIRNTRKFSSL